MSDQQFDIFFRGDIVAGQAVAEVKERLGKLFKLEAAQVEGLFSGRPTAIRRNLDGASAEKYQQALLKIGAVAELRAAKVVDAPAAQAVAEPSSASTSAAESVNAEDGLSLAPAGSDVLRPDERSKVITTVVDVSALALEPGGGEILHEGEKRPAEIKQVDTSHLEVLPPR
ncbi:hypothetical protein A9Q89_11850 [Gammaproteobacteria bacterium 53_120_T64]|nr:hypothetical protein A9Q89_11850 [Gammaproteobacteria bacterium 53_120_T64]